MVTHLAIFNVDIFLNIKSRENIVEIKEICISPILFFSAELFPSGRNVAGVWIDLLKIDFKQEI